MYAEHKITESDEFCTLSGEALHAGWSLTKQSVTMSQCYIVTWLLYSHWPSLPCQLVINQTWFPPGKSCFAYMSHHPFPGSESASKHKWVHLHWLLVLVQGKKVLVSDQWSHVTAIPGVTQFVWQIYLHSLIPLIDIFRPYFLEVIRTFSQWKGGIPPLKRDEISPKKMDWGIAISRPIWWQSCSYHPPQKTTKRLYAL